MRNFPQKVNELKLDSCVAFNINYCRRQPNPSPEQRQRTRLHVADGLLPLLVAVLLLPGHDLQQPLGAATAHLRRGHEARQPRHSQGRKFTQPSRVSFLAWHGYINLKVFHLLADPEPDLGLVD